MTVLITDDAIVLSHQLASMDAQRLRSYRENLAFYKGQQWTGQPRRQERRLVFNYARTLVEKTASYLMSGLSFAVDAEDGSEAEAERARRAEKALRLVHESNNLAQLDFDSEIDVSVLGDGVFKVTWDARERRVRVAAPDVQGIYAWWLGDDVSRVWRVVCRYQLSQEEAQRLYGATAVISSSTGQLHSVVEVWTDESFELLIDGRRLESKANPYGFVPFVLYPNLREPTPDSFVTAARTASAAG